MQPQTIRIGLHSWVIQDGNYGDFKNGERRAFALEFWPRGELQPLNPDAERERRLESLGGCEYQAAGEVTFANGRWWVFDVGLPLYLDQPRSYASAGTWLTGRISVAIDPFIYFEARALEPDAPALIHDWRIVTIDADDTPRLERSPGSFERDETRQSWRPVDRTEAWDHGGEYLLECVRLSESPRRSLKAG